MRFIVVLSSALEGCRVAVCFDVNIAVGVVNSIGHFLIGAIFFDHRRRTSWLGVSIDWWCLGRGGGRDTARLTAQRLARVALVAFFEGHCCCGADNGLAG
jgi:hypothetical protein